MTVMVLCALLFADVGAPPQIAGVDVVEHLGAQVPLDVELTDVNGTKVRLGSLFADGRPVLMTLAYFRCEMLCDLVLRGVADGIHDLDWKLGREFRAITVSFDPRDTWADAGRKQSQALAAAGADTGWVFLTGSAADTSRLASALGFQYMWDAPTEQFAHPAVAFALSPDGKISRYLYGVDFPAQQIKLSLLDASQGKTGSFIDKVIMSCFHWDPSTRRFGVFVAGVLRAGAAVVLASLVALLLFMWRIERRKARAS